MEIAQLRSFLKVAECGNVTAASEAVFLSQPAVTQQIKCLERELNTTLFERTSRGMRLTEAGEVLRRYADLSLAMLEDGRRVIEDASGRAAGKLVLGAGVTTSVFSLPDWLRQFRQLYPHVDVIVRTGRSKEIAQLALDREIDIGLVTSPVQDEHLEALTLFEERIEFVVTANDRYAEKAIAARDLAALPLILFSPGTGFRSYLDAALGLAGISVTVKMESDSVEAIKSFVATGLGASFLPYSAVAAELAKGEFCRISVEGMPVLTRKTAIIYRKDRYLCEAGRGFLGLLRDVYP